MMRIVQALGWYFPESLGGTEVYVAGLSRRLRAAGCDVTVAAPEPGASAERTYEHEEIPVYRYPIAALPTRAEAQGLSAVRGAARFHEWLRIRRPDVVHFHAFVTGLGLAELRAAVAAGARVIVTAHTGSLGWICQRGTMMRWGERLCDGVCAPAKCAACALEHRGLGKWSAQLIGALPPRVGRTARPLHGKLGTALSMGDLIAQNQIRQGAMLATVEKLVLLTEWALRAAAANGAPLDKLALNRLGLGHEKWSPKPGPDDLPTTRPVTVGYLGRFDAIKGIHDLARALTSLPREVPIRVELRGPVPSERERACVSELRTAVHADPRVSFEPAVPHAHVLHVLAGYDVLCCPAVSLEGGPTTAIEAHAVGTPVIGTRIGGLAELVTDGVNGRLVAPGDWRALAGVLDEIARDPRGTVDAWRRALPRARTMDEVTADYQGLYAR